MVLFQDFRTLHEVSRGGYQPGFISRLCMVAVHNMHNRAVNEDSSTKLCLKFHEEDFRSALISLRPTPFFIFDTLGSTEIYLLVAIVDLVCIRELGVFNFEMVRGLIEQRCIQMNIPAMYSRQVLLSRFCNLIDNGILAQYVDKKFGTKYLTSARHFQNYKLRFLVEDVIKYLEKKQTNLATDVQEWFRDVITHHCSPGKTTKVNKTPTMGQNEQP